MVWEYILTPLAFVLYSVTHCTSFWLLDLSLIRQDAQKVHSSQCQDPSGISSRPTQ